MSIGGLRPSGNTPIWMKERQEEEERRRQSMMVHNTNSNLLQQVFANHFLFSQTVVKGCDLFENAKLSLWPL